MLTYKDRFCNLLRYLFFADHHEVTVRQQHPTPVSSESNSSEPLMEWIYRDFKKCFRTTTTTTSLATVSSFRFREIYFVLSSKTSWQNWLVCCCCRELVLQQLYKVICFKYHIMRRYPVLPGAHIVVRGRRLTWSTLRTWRVFNLHSSINPYPTAFPYGNGMVLHFYQQQESSTTKTVHKVINKRLKAYV